MSLATFIYLYQNYNQYILVDLIEKGIITPVDKNGERYYRSGFNNSNQEYLDFSYREDKQSLSDIHISDSLYKLFGFKKK